MPKMIDFEIDFESFGEVNAAFIQIDIRTKAEATQALIDMATSIMNESWWEVPVDTGALKASRYILEPEIHPESVSIEMGYGGPNVQTNPKSHLKTTEYTNIVHEAYESLLRVSAPTGKSKFLEDPFYRQADIYIETLGARLRTLFREGRVY